LLLASIYTGSNNIQKLAGAVIFAFVVVGIYLYFHVMSLAFGAKGLPLGRPLVQA